MSTEDTMITPDGDPIVAWATYGSVRGYGPLRTTREHAALDLRDDRHAAKVQCGYSDRKIVAVDMTGICWSEDVSAWIPGPGGHRAARYDLISPCREALDNLRAGSRRATNLDPVALAVLRARGLVTEHTDGLVEAHPRAAGYCADPTTFDG